MYRAHPATEVFPMMSDAALNTLAADIATAGLVRPVTLFEESGETFVLDGRNRLEACRRAGIEPKTLTWRGDPIAFVWSVNMERRNLTDSQKAMIAAKFATLKRGGDRRSEAFKAPTGALVSDAVCQQAAAKLVGVSRQSVYRAHRVRENGAPELVAAVEAGEVSVRAACGVADLPHAEQRHLVASGGRAVAARAKQQPPTPPFAPRLVVHDGGVMQETKSGVFQKTKQNLYDLSVTPKWGNRHEDHARVRELLAQGMRAGEIQKLTGLEDHFVHHSMAPYRIRAKVMTKILEDTQVTAEMWVSWSGRIEQKWPGASREEKDALIAELEACRRGAATFIRELKKDARNEGESE